VRDRDLGGTVAEARGATVTIKDLRDGSAVAWEP
jgi:hypothetical protein